MLAQQRVVLGLDLLLELLDLTRHHLEPPLHLGDLVLRLDQVLRVEVAVGAHGLVQVLLLLEARLTLGNLLLQLQHRNLALLDRVERLRVTFGCLDRLGRVALFLRR